MPEHHAARTGAGRPDRALFSFAQIQHVLRVEFGRAQRYRYPLTCLVLAVDQLGTIRDTGGYEAKERLVEGVIELLADATRSSDFLGRTADDRLIAVVPHTPAEGARVLARRLVDSVRALTVGRGAGVEHVTLSLGACANGDSSVMYFDALLEGAQRAFDEAVAQGGNRYVETSLDGPA